MLAIIKISLSELCYPEAVNEYLGKQSPDVITALGNLDLLKLKKKAFFCSSKCPGNLILKTFDYFRGFKDSGRAIISGFHSPMEKECLNILIRGEMPIIICLARSMEGARLHKSWKSWIQDGRMLILSPFPERIKRISEKSAFFRNEFIAALANEIFVPYAAPGSKTQAFCRKVLDWGKHLFTFNAPENAHMISQGIQTIEV